MIKAIETRYRGYRFRSRLEARWAVFFTNLSIDWQYEPQGFEMAAGERYLPDLYLPHFNGGLYVEVKPEGGDFEKAERFARSAHKQMFFAEGIPEDKGYRIITFSMDENDPDGMIEECCCFHCRYLGGGKNGHEHRLYMGWGDEIIYLGGMGGALVDSACEAAKSARFEHGESPL
jgi:hypothetical protein